MCKLATEFFPFMLYAYSKLVLYCCSHNMATVSGGVGVAHSPVTCRDPDICECDVWKEPLRAPLDESVVSMINHWPGFRPAFLQRISAHCEFIYLLNSVCILPIPTLPWTQFLTHIPNGPKGPLKSVANEQVSPPWSRTGGHFRQSQESGGRKMKSMFLQKHESELKPLCDVKGHHDWADFCVAWREQGLCYLWGANSWWVYISREQCEVANLIWCDKAMEKGP